MANTNTIGNGKRNSYQLSVGEIGQRTGDNMLSDVPLEMQKTIKADADQVVIQVSWLEPVPQRIN